MTGPNGFTLFGGAATFVIGAVCGMSMAIAACSPSPSGSNAQAVGISCDAMTTEMCSTERAKVCLRDFDGPRGVAQARRDLLAGDARLLFLTQPGDDDGVRDVVPGASRCGFPNGTDALKRLSGRIEMKDWHCSAKVYEYATAYNAEIERAKPGSLAKACG